MEECSRPGMKTMKFPVFCFANSSTIEVNNIINHCSYTTKMAYQNMKKHLWF